MREAPGGGGVVSLKKLLVVGVGALAILLVAVLALPALVDWNARKADIAARLSAAAGRTVEIDGDLGLSLLPAPHLTVENLRLLNPPGFQGPDMARLARLDARVALMPLLGGHIQVETVTLVKPEFIFELSSDGRFNWTVAAERAAPVPAAEAGGGLATAISLDQLHLEGGSVLYRDGMSGRETRIDDLRARLIAGSLIGPFQVQGDFTVHGVPIRGEMTSGRFGPAAAVPVRAAFETAGGEAAFRFAGIMSEAPDGGRRVQGDLRAEGNDAAAALAALRLATAGHPMLAAAAHPFAVRAALEADGGTTTVHTLEVQLGDTRAAGNGAVTLGAIPHAKLVLALNRLDLDAWLAAGRKAAPPAGGRTPAARSAPAAPVPSVPFALPLGVLAELDLSADAVVYKGGVVRQARLEAALADGVVAIDRLGALLPGGSDLVMAGSLAAADGAPTADLRLEGNAENLRGLLDWLQLDLRGVPADRLRRASLSARVQGRPDRFDVTGVDLRIDTSRVTGGLAYVDRGRPAFGVRLDIDRLSLDAYRSEPPPTVARPQDGARAPDAAARAPDALVAELLGKADVNLRLTAESLIAANTAVQGLVLDAQSAGGVITVRDVSVTDVAGVTAKMSGQIGGLAPLRNAHLTLEAKAATLAGVPRLVAWPAVLPLPEHLGAAAVRGRLAGDADKVALELTIDAAGGRLEAGGSVGRLVAGPAALDLKLRAVHERPEQVARLFGAALPAGLGPLDLYGAISGAPGAFAVQDIQGTIAGTAVRGKAKVETGGPRPRVDAEVQTGDLDLDRFGGTASSAHGAASSAQGAGLAPGEAGAAPPPSGAPAGWGALRALDGRLQWTGASVTAGGVRLDNPALRATLDDGVLILDQLDGGLAGGQIGATGRLAAPAGGAPQAQLAVTVVRAKPVSGLALGPLALSGGTVDLDLDLTAVGASEQAMLQTLAGTGRIAARDGALGGFDLGAVASRLTRVERPQDALDALMRGLQGGSTPFAGLDGTVVVERGTVRTNDMRLTAPLGAAGLAGTVSLPARSMDIAVRLDARADAEVPPLVLRLRGPWAQPTRSFDLKEIQSFLARRASGRPEEVIRGLLDGLRP